MKKLIFLFIVIPAIAFSQNTQKETPENQDDLKKSAEAFVTNWFKNFEDKKWDKIINLVSEDGTLYTSTQTSALHDEVKSIIEFYQTNVTDYKVEVYSLSTEVFGQTEALVTARYIETGTLKGNIELLDYLDIYLLEMKQGAWKIKTLYSQYFQPVIFSDNVDKKWQTGKAGPYYRFNGALGQMSGISLYFLEEYKKNGKSPAQIGKMVGTRFAKTWDKSSGFEGLSSGFMWVIQSISPYMEVLERNETSVKIKYENFFKQEVKNWNITDHELLEYFQNAFGEIANHNGGTCSIIEDGKYYVLTLIEK